MFEHVTDHASRALGRMLTQYRDSAQFKGILNTLSAEVQAVEDAIVGLAVVRDIDGATGATLDKIAKLIGALDRSYALGNTDAALRLLIKTQIIVNKATGTDADYYELIAYMTTVGGTPEFKVRHGEPATWALGDVCDPTGEFPHNSVIEILCLGDDATDISILNTLTANDAQYFAKQFASMAPAGARAILRYRSTACTVGFRFSGGVHADRAGFGVGRCINSKDR